MKKTLVLSAVSLFAVNLFAASASTSSSPYLVATRTAPAKIVRFIDGDGARVEREVVPFRSVNGYEIELTPEQAKTLSRMPDVRYVEPVRERHAFDLADRDSAGPRAERAALGGSGSALANRQSIPWGIDKVGARQVWRVTTGAHVKVGIIDTGIDRNHPDLKAEYKGGYDFVDNDGDPQDGNGHGTHVAGTVAAADDGKGVVGVAPNVDLYSLRILNDKGSGTTANVIRAVDWAIANHLDIISLSLGSPERSDLEEEAFQRAADAGILAIAASGNEPADPVSFPGAYPTVLAVGAVDSTLTLANFSSKGPEVAVVAPGVRVFSDYPQGRGSLTSVVTSDSSVDASLLGYAPAGSVSGQLVRCGYGRPEDFPAGMSGKIALIQRGSADGIAMPFADKVRNAHAAGVAGVVIFDPSTDADPSGWTLGAAGDWPVTVGVAADMAAQILTRVGTTVTAQSGPDDYETLSGTSMATPHVTGIAALLKALAPAATAAQIRQAITSSARDLGAVGFDDMYGNGMVDAYRAAMMLAPQAFAPERSVHHR